MGTCLASLAAFLGAPSLALLGAAGPLAAQQPPLPSQLPSSSDKVVAYDLRVTLLEDGKTIQGRVGLDWRNTTFGPTQEQYWHVYNNAWAGADSLFLRESRALGNERLPREWGDTKIHAVNLLVGEEEMENPLDWEFVPQPGAPEDRTVMRVALPEAVEPGETVSVVVDFTTTLPPAFRRSGTDGEGGFVHAVQWYPKIGVFEELGGELRWNCEPYHALTEFYADYGDFRVELTVPDRYEGRVAATGTLGSAVRRGGGTVTYFITAEDVHDFAWTADPDFVVMERDFEPSEWADPDEEIRVANALGRSVEAVRPRPTRMILYLQPEHEEYTEEYFESLGKAIYYFGLWYGSYPYETISLIDPAHNARRTGGMEYPRLITGGVRKGNAKRTLSPEGVTIHEFGHQFWYGLVGNDEFRHAWLDEGLNVHSTGRVLRKGWDKPLATYSVLGRQFYGFAPVKAPSYGAGDARAMFTLERVELPEIWELPAISVGLRRSTSAERWVRELPFASSIPRVERDPVWSARRVMATSWSDPIARPTFELLEGSMRGVNAYQRPALTLETMAGLMGETRFTRMMRAFHERWRFQHPRPDDFFAVVREFGASATVGSDPGVEVDWTAFWDQAYHGNELLDFGVHRLANLSVAGRPGQGEESEGGALWDVIVEVRRFGGFRVPVEVRITWADGSVTEEVWDGQEWWVRYSYPAAEQRAASVVVDPDRRLMLDQNWLNNSRLAEPARDRACNLSMRAMILAQQLLQHFGGVG